MLLISTQERKKENSKKAFWKIAGNLKKTEIVLWHHELCFKYFIDSTEKIANKSLEYFTKLKRSTKICQKLFNESFLWTYLRTFW